MKTQCPAYSNPMYSMTRISITTKYKTFSTTLATVHRSRWFNCWSTIRSYLWQVYNLRCTSSTSAITEPRTGELSMTLGQRWTLKITDSTDRLISAVFLQSYGFIRDAEALYSIERHKTRISIINKPSFRNTIFISWALSSHYCISESKDSQGWSDMEQQLTNAQTWEQSYVKTYNN